MMLDARRVRTLRLERADPARARLAAQLVSEALRIATFPGDGQPGRLLIRRLDLGLFSARLSPQALAARVSHVAREASGSAVVFSAPEAASSDAIRVPREVDVWIELGRRAAGRGSFDMSAWFWPLLVPALRATSDRRIVLELALDTLTRLDTPAPALSALLVALVDDGTADSLLDVLTERHARTALAGMGFVLGAAAQPFESSRHQSTAGVEAETFAAGIGKFAADGGWPKWLALLQRFVPRWGAEQARSSWLCTTALWASVPGRSSLPGQEERARALARHLEETGSELFRRLPDRTTERREPREQEQPVRVPDLAQPAAMPDRVPTTLPLATEFGGLLFILPVLDRLGFRAFLASHPHLVEADFGRRVLRRICDVLGVPRDDAVHQILTLTELAPGECAFEIPESWIGSLVEVDSVSLRASSFEPAATIAIDQRGVPLALWYREPSVRTQRWPGLLLCAPRECYAGETAIEVALDAWQHGVAAWLARFTELNLDTLVRRHGALQLTPTHVDVIFDLEQSDVRLRRAALDLDLGYVPQLGRVVAFHYCRRAELVRGSL